MSVDPDPSEPPEARLARYREIVTEFMMCTTDEERAACLRRHGKTEESMRLLQDSLQCINCPGNRGHESRARCGSSVHYPRHRHQLARRRVCFCRRT